MQKRDRCEECKHKSCICNKNSLFFPCEKCKKEKCNCKKQLGAEVDLIQKDIELTQGQAQTLGNQDQTATESQGLTQGDLTQTGTESQGQTLGDQTQTGTESQSQTMGDQTQTNSQGQSGSTLTQTQNPTQTGGTVTQEQNPTQTQTGTATQTQQANPTNNGTADVTQTVSGVTVNVPVTVDVSCGCNEKKEKFGSKNNKDCCDCCARALGNLLRQIQPIQITNLETINIYLTNGLALPANPIPGQTITNVNDCATVSFATGPVVTTPSTIAQLCKVAGFSTTGANLVAFLTNFANTCTNNTGDTCGCGCGKFDCGNQFCNCNTCANGIGAQLSLLTGAVVNLIIEGVPTAINGVRILKVCDCLAFFIDDAASTIYVFTLCSIEAFTPATTTSTPLQPPQTPPGTPIITLLPCCSESSHKRRKRRK
ncbi:hypothetical protein [Fictibacillus fluitans]|uniref:Uncharacterized protein n=1 Tax=Fictibacillus fluitans TaxID=3058422 RepID=A0ABT8HWF4_9BACL|nr:hypothetical protein [Fictibacillus sp. NE201]MDN4525118.1 hypothetical protein [Fictibacillus sp. NE201]